TLLSSQTTDTPGTTQTNVQDRSGATFQTYPIPPGFANHVFRSHTVKNQPPPTTARHKSEPFSRPFKKGVWPLSFRISGGDSENNTRTHTQPQIGCPRC
ncbi:hypothetical protein, partial [Pseudarthrobacter enclensis]|uniref:hypothetical protein n=1 Tax=Pseudarthrobacter enclensis TaxID=993070 RepID=UPI0027D91DCB